MWLTCMICDSDFDSFQHLYAFGKCDHVVCSVCILLERTRKKSNNCALCRNEMQDVVVTSTPCLTYSDFDGKTLKTAKKGNSGGLADICYNHGIFFPKDYYDAVVTKLLSQYCHVCSRSDFRDFDALQEHYNNAHKGLSRCKVCNDYQLTLPYCMEVYTCNQLDAHMRAEVSAGDGVESIGIGGGHRGHPKCGYCVDLYFYDDGGLAEHINKNHFLCENCTHSDPKKMMHYLPDRDAWMAHNRDRHFVCEHQQCQQSQCVFYTLSDFNPTITVSIEAKSLVEAVEAPLGPKPKYCISCDQAGDLWLLDGAHTHGSANSRVAQQQQQQQQRCFCSCTGTCFCSFFS